MVKDEKKLIDFQKKYQINLNKRQDLIKKGLTKTEEYNKLEMEGIKLSNQAKGLKKYYEKKTIGDRYKSLFEIIFTLLTGTPIAPIKFSEEKKKKAKNK